MICNQIYYDLNDTTIHQTTLGMGLSNYRLPFDLNIQFNSYYLVSCISPRQGLKNSN